MRIDATAGDGFSFDFNGRDMKFEDIMVLLKQWEQQAPIDIREATTRFKTFVDVCLPPPFTHLLARKQACFPASVHEREGESARSRARERKRERERDSARASVNTYA